MSYELYGENGEITGEISSLEVLEDGVILEHIKSPGSRSSGSHGWPTGPMETGFLVKKFHRYSTPVQAGAF